LELTVAKLTIVVIDVGPTGLKVANIYYYSLYNERCKTCITSR